MELKRGTPIRIGDKYASRYGYDQITHRTTIYQELYDEKQGTHLVQCPFSRSDSWYVHEEDVIPLRDNKGAVVLLKEQL